MLSTYDNILTKYGP